MNPIKSEDELQAFENWLTDTLCEWTDFDPDGQIGMALSSKLSDIRTNLKRQHERELERKIDNIQLDCNNCGNRTIYLEASLRNFNTGMCGACGADALSASYQSLTRLSNNQEGKKL